MMVDAWKTVRVGVVLLAVLLIACGKDEQKPEAGAVTASLVGTYDCAHPSPPAGAPPGPEEAPDVIQLLDDGMLKITQPAAGHTADGTWSVTGDRVVFKIEGDKAGSKAEGGRLIGDDGGICTKRSGAATGSIAGSYNCLQPGSSEPDVVEVRANGTMSITQGGNTSEGTWSAQGNSGAFNPGTPDEDPFTIQDGRIVFQDGTTCTRN